jgi:hypothetical protein
MKRTILLARGWLAAAAGLYVALVMLEFDWNLYDWQPRLDLKASGLIFGTLAAFAAMWCLARVSCNRFSRGVSLAACLALLALAVYVLPSEPMTQGLFAREAASPLWYRAARFVLLALSSVFWVLGLLRRRQRPAQNRPTKEPAAPVR